MSNIETSIVALIFGILGSVAGYGLGVLHTKSDTKNKKRDSGKSYMKKKKAIQLTMFD